MQFKKTLLRYGWSKSRDVGAVAWKSFESIAFIKRPRTADMVWSGLDRLFRRWKQRLYMRRCICLVYLTNSLHLPRKYARIFVRGHYLFREANSFPRAKLEENSELRGITKSHFRFGQDRSNSVSYDPRSYERNLCNSVYRSLKKSGLQRGLNT